MIQWKSLQIQREKPVEQHDMSRAVSQSRSGSSVLVIDLDVGKRKWWGERDGLSAAHNILYNKEISSGFLIANCEYTVKKMQKNPTQFTVVQKFVC